MELSDDDGRPGPLTWHWAPNGPKDPKGRHLAPDNGDVACNTSSAICYRWNGKKWITLDYAESSLIIISRRLVKLADGPMNVMIVIAATEAAAIGLVEAGPSVAAAAKRQGKCVAMEIAKGAAGGAAAAIGVYMYDKSKDAAFETFIGGVATGATNAAINCR